MWILRYIVIHTLTHSHPQPFDDAQYSEVRKGPFYKPKRSTSSTPPPIPESTLSPPPPQSDEIDGGGLSELDNLLEMLNDTQKNIQEGIVIISSVNYTCVGTSLLVKLNMYAY